MNEYEEINVAEIPTATRHGILIGKILALKPQEGLVIKVDHDPKPLYYVLKEEHKMAFQWKYIEEGPINWEVLIIRESGYETMTVKELINQDLARMMYFANFDPDYCLHDEVTLQEVAGKYGKDVQQLFGEVSGIHQLNQPHIQYWNLSLFLDFITENYHSYERVLLNKIHETMQKVVTHHQEEFPFLQDVKERYEKLHRVMIDHFREEEEYLFVMLRSRAHNDQLASSYQHVEHDHDETLDIFREIKELTNDFTPYDSACPLTRHMYEMLRTLYEDVMCHAYLEHTYLTNYFKK
ncbi:MAG: DUF2249 domain-containing protein [Cyclobacteriaceae bacterium]|nr:DUF2249 domain-containing protein [Cyclobacteriaceae bacterium]